MDNNNNINNNNNSINIENTNSIIDNLTPQSISDNSNNNISNVSKPKQTNITRLIDTIKNKKLFNNICYSYDIRLDFLKKYDTININNRYELIKSNNHNYELLIPINNIISFKLYFDLDLKIDEHNKTINNDNMVDKFIVLFINKINDYFNHNFDNINSNISDVNILTATTENKYSYHIIFNNILFQNIDIDMKYMINKLITIFNDDYIVKNNFIDTTVYKKNQLFRLLNNSKIGTTNILTFSKYHHTNNILKNKQLETFISSTQQHNIKFCIDNNILENKIKLNNNYNDNINNNNNNIDTKLENSQYDLINFLYLNDFEIMKNILDNLTSIYYDYYNKWFHIITILKNIFNIMNYDSLNIIEYFSLKSKKYNKNINEQIYKKIVIKKINYDEFNKYIFTIMNYLKLSNIETYNIINNQIKKFKINNKSTIDYFNKKKYEQIENYYNINNDCFINKHNFTYVEINKSDLISVNDKYYLDKNTILDNIPNYDIIMIKSFMGGGKNENIYNTINNFNFKSILIITTRVFYSNNIYNEFLKKCNLKFDLYNQNKNKNSDGLTSDYLICSLYSLHKINKLKNYQLIILDEIESINNCFSSEECHNNKFITNFNRYDELILNSQKIIISDRDLNNTTINFFSNYKNKKILLINNLYYPYNHKCYKYQSEKHMYNIMMDEISGGKKIIIYHNEREQIEKFKNEIKKLHPEKKIIYHIGNGDDNKLLFNNDINNIWDCDVLLYNNCITVGVSFNIEHFDNIYCYAHTVNMRDLFQSLNRVRTIKSNSLHIYLTEKNEPYDDNLDNIDIGNNILFEQYQPKIYRDILLNNDNNTDIITKLFDLNKKHKNISLNDVIYGHLIPVCSDKIKYLRFNLIIENKLNYNSELIFKYFLTLQNYELINIENSDNLQKKIKTEKKQPITDEQYKNVKYYYDKYHIKFNNDIKKILDYLNGLYNKIDNIDINISTIDLVKKLIYFKKKFKYNINDEFKIFQNYILYQKIYNQYFYLNNNNNNILNQYMNSYKNGYMIEFQKNKYDINNFQHHIFKILEIEKNLLSQIKLTDDKLIKIYNYIDTNKKNIKITFNIRTTNIKKTENINHYILKQFLYRYGLKIKKKKLIIKLDDKILLNLVENKQYIKNENNNKNIIFLNDNNKNDDNLNNDKINKIDDDYINDDEYISDDDKIIDDDIIDDNKFVNDSNDSNEEYDDINDEIKNKKYDIPILLTKIINNTENKNIINYRKTHFNINDNNNYSLNELIRINNTKILFKK